MRSLDIELDVPMLYSEKHRAVREKVARQNIEIEKLQQKIQMLITEKNTTNEMQPRCKQVKRSKRRKISIKRRIIIAYYDNVPPQMRVIFWLVLFLSVVLLFAGLHSLYNTYWST